MDTLAIGWRITLGLAVLAVVLAGLCVVALSFVIAVMNGFWLSAALWLCLWLPASAALWVMLLGAQD